MPRFRLRFLLQEFDLIGPEVLIGRSPDCHITIEDPLISRRHARISIEASEALVEDLGSRNGVRLNGRQIEQKTPLRDGDRLRLGTQELLFSVVGRRDRPARPTGYMRVCQGCGTPYPEGSPACPHCGAAAVEEEETVSGMLLEPARNWTFQLLGEVIERALSTGRTVEADRLMRRAAREVDDRLAGGERLDSEHLEMISSFAIRLAHLLKVGDWVAWALTLNRRQGRMLAQPAVDHLKEASFSELPDLAPALDAYIAWFRNQGEPDPSTQSRLQELETILSGARRPVAE